MKAPISLSTLYQTMRTNLLDESSLIHIFIGIHQPMSSYSAMMWKLYFFSWDYLTRLGIQVFLRFILFYFLFAINCSSHALKHSSFGIFVQFVEHFPNIYVAP